MSVLESEVDSEMRQAVREFAQAEIPRYETEEFYNVTPRKLFSAGAGLGLASLVIPEKYGGLDGGYSLGMVVTEELAAVNCGAAVFFSVHNMVSGIVSRYGNDLQKERFLEELGSGNLLGAFALTEPQAGSDARAITTRARLDGDHYILNGEKCYITSAGYADLYLVFARTSDEGGSKGVSCFVVTSDAPGLSISKPELKMGAELSPIASLTFSDMKVPAENLLGEAGKGYGIAMSGLIGGRINIAACANGVSRHAIALALAYAKEREQFGQQIVNFQGIQFMLADMEIGLCASQAMTAKTAAMADKNPRHADLRKNSSIAKCNATDRAMEITTDAVQILGGAGYLREYKVEGLMRDAKMLQIVEGTNQIQRVVIAAEMIGRQA